MMSPETAASQETVAEIAAFLRALTVAPTPSAWQEHFIDHVLPQVPQYGPLPRMAETPQSRGDVVYRALLTFLLERWAQRAVQQQDHGVWKRLYRLGDLLNPLYLAREHFVQALPARLEDTLAQRLVDCLWRYGQWWRAWLHLPADSGPSVGSWLAIFLETLGWQPLDIWRRLGFFVGGHESAWRAAMRFSRGRFDATPKPYDWPLWQAACQRIGEETPLPEPLPRSQNPREAAREATREAAREAVREAAKARNAHPTPRCRRPTSASWRKPSPACPRQAGATDRLPARKSPAAEPVLCRAPVAGRKANAPAPPSLSSTANSASTAPTHSTPTRCWPSSCRNIRSETPPPSAPP